MLLKYWRCQNIIEALLNTTESLPNDAPDKVSNVIIVIRVVSPLAFRSRTNQSQALKRFGLFGV